ncbi:MAG: phenylalanine--tRNA ligase subunit beta [Planctomycetes bacterium]|nr:phenylalanine--tRNA ligase subunit beta [Planctomycetota bacterium]
MLISLNWLSDYVDLSDFSAEQVGELLSLHTAEVEGIEEVGAAIADVVIGEVLECDKHPDADKLSVTRVAYGSNEEVNVVCGAPNVRAGLKVAFAPVGSKLPGNLKIKKAKLRGVVSCGMICSERELEMSDEHGGILELPEDAPVGMPLVEYLDLQDFVIELDNKSLTHRPDLWGHYGFARELAAILGRELRPMELAEVAQEVAPSEPDGRFTIRIEDANSCRFYAGLEVSLDGAGGPSPKWMQRRLRAVGQRPIDLLVDLTNYLLLETGQPTHVFDRTKVRGDLIRVRRAEEGERLKTLDDQERELTNEDLLIADAEGGVALAGVMGGANSEVGDGTSTILLEAAHFAPTRVRRTAHRLSLRTEASSRFEKTLDPVGTWQAVERFVALLRQLRPEARVLGPARVAGSSAPDAVQLELDAVRTVELLGLPLSTDEVSSILRRLGFTVVAKGDQLTVDVPSWRSSKDVRKPIDLVEEVGRLAGYHRIDAQPLVAPIEAIPADPMRSLTRRLGQRLMGAHQAFESQGYTFLQRDWATWLDQRRESFVLVDNPVQDGVDLVRQDWVPSLLDQAAGNWRAVPTGSLFEIGKGYTPQGPGLPAQQRWLCVVLWQRIEDEHHGPGSSFGRARAVAEDLLRVAGVRWAAVPAAAEQLPGGGHPAQSLTYGNGAMLVSTVHPRVRAALDLTDAKLTVVRVDLEALLEAQGRSVSFQPPSKFPAIKCDIALALPANLSFAEIEVALRKAGGKSLVELELFDVYEEGSLAAQGQRSIAFHATLQAGDRTLTDKDEQRFLKKISEVAERLGGSLRS